MWAKLLQVVLMPLIEKSVVALFNYIREWFRERKRKKELDKEIKEKIEKFKRSQTDEDINTSFDDLP